MNTPCKYALAVLLVSAARLPAQVGVSAPAPPTAVPVYLYQETLTTALVGFTGTQTAQLTVLNMSPATTATLAGCEVQLAFYDSQSRLLKQGNATNLAPGASTVLTLGHNEAQPGTATTTTTRVPVRGQVATVPSPSATGTASGTVVVLASCSLFTSLELYDNASGVTQTLTTDTRPVQTGELVPLAAMPMAR